MITLKSLTSATEQQVFDHVATHLLNQGRPSYSSEHHMCAYRGDGGLKCAAGCLIADDEYDIKMEVNSWEDLVDSLSTVPVAHKEMIGDLQHVHDEAHDLLPGDNVYHHWLNALREFADRRNLRQDKLKYRVVDEEDLVLFTEETQAEAEEQLTHALNHGHDAYLQAPGDY